MGVVNLTPDSFSDGGRYLDAGAAAAHAMRLVEEGADIVDLGAESTRPGAAPVASDLEWERLEPVLRRLSRESLVPAVSLDTRKPELMLRGADLGAAYINDVSGGAPDEV